MKPMTHDSDISRTMLWDAMYQAVQSGMAAGFEGKKTIDGKKVEDWITDFINILIGQEEEDEN